MVSIGRINSFHIIKDVASLVSEICEVSWEQDATFDPRLW